MQNNVVEILLVEDNDGDAELTMRALRRKNIGNSITHLKDGEEALEFLFGTGRFAGRNIQLLPKVVLLDLKMPKVDGLEVLARIKANDRTKTIPVVVLTSSKEHPDIDRCYQLGVNSYIVKPVGFENFTAAVADLGMYWVLLNQSPH